MTGAFLRAVRLVAIAFLLFGVGTLSLTGTASAQERVSFSKIDVVGNQRIEPATIRNFAGIQPGQAVTRGQINKAYQQLIATGLFEEVTITPRGGRLVIEVQEYPTINRINFERNKKLKDEKLAEVINSRPRHTYSPTVAEADAALIVEAYRQAGRLSAEVRPQIIRRSDNRVDLVFEIFEGDVIEVERLGFVGNRVFSDRRLRRVLNTKQAGLLRRFVKSDTFVADRIEFDKQVLTDFYLSRGFVDFQILSVATQVARNQNGFFVTFTVQEGQQYRFGDVTVTSDLEDIDPAEYQKVVRVKAGQVYSPNALETAIDRIETQASNNGLNFIRATPRVTRDDRSRTLAFEIVVERGPRVFVERIDIEGNETTLDRVIRRQFDTVEGDPFNPRAIRRASDRIKALGFFSRSDVQTREGSAGDRIIVDVDVEEQQTGEVSFGLTYGASAGIGGQISVSESNFLGRGQRFKIELGGGIDKLNTSIAFGEPQFLDRNIDFDFRIYRNTTTQQNAFYDTALAGIVPQITFPTGANSKLALRYRRSGDTVNNITGTPSPLIVAGTTNVSALGFTYTYNNRGTRFDPNAGVVLRVSQEFAGFGGSARFSKTAALAGIRTSIFNDAVILNAEIEGGLLNMFSGTSRITERFFMGNEIMRGFALNGIGPRDLNVANMDALGGNIFAVARLEANFPLGLPEEYRISGGVFMDVGSVWSLNNTDGGTSGVDGLQLVDDSMILRSVIGVSIFWETAVGPLRFNLSRVLSGPTYDQPESFSLSIGSRF